MFNVSIYYVKVTFSIYSRNYLNAFALKHDLRILDHEEHKAD